MNKLPNIGNILPSIRGMNFWTLKQKIKNHTTQKTSTIQLLHRIDVYRFADSRDLVWFRLLGFMPASNLNIRFCSGNQKDVKFAKRHGELKRTTGDMKCHSFVLQFLQSFESLWAKGQGTGVNSDDVLIYDTGHTLRTMNAGQTSWKGSSTYFAGGVEAPSGNANYGILVGTGTTSPANDDYTMETLIAHGSGAGQLQYNATSIGAAGVVGANVDLVIVRPLVNGSGSTITLKEVGLAAASYQPWYFLWAHDAVNQDIANTEVAIVSYCVRTTV